MGCSSACFSQSLEFICSVGKIFLTDQGMQRADWFVRFICNGLFVYFLVERISVIYIGAILFVMVIYLAFMHQKVKGKPLNWEYLLQKKERK